MATMEELREVEVLIEQWRAEEDKIQGMLDVVSAATPAEQRMMSQSASSSTALRDLGETGDINPMMNELFETCANIRDHLRDLETKRDQLKEKIQKDSNKK